MRIEDFGSEAVRAEQARRARRASGQEGDGDGSDGAAAIERADSVEISDAGRSLAAELPPTPVREGDGELTSEQVEQLRARVEQGVFDRPEVIDEVAARLLSSGDV